MMYLLYIDESGVVEIGGAGGHFVLCGVAIAAEDWKKLEARIEGIKSKYRLRGQELHTAWMAKRYIQQEKIPDFEKLSDLERVNRVHDERKKYLRLAAATKPFKRVKEISRDFRKTEPYLHLTWDERKSCLGDVAKEVGSWCSQNVRLFAEAVEKASVMSSAPEDTFEMAFSQVISRFQLFLENRGKFLQTELLGLIIQDNNPTVSLKLTSAMRRFHRQGTIWRDITNIVETPLFVDSQLTSMVQVADICAYAIRRFFDNNETELFEGIYPTFDRAGSNVVGIRHYTGSRPCTCKVCKDHCR